MTNKQYTPLVSVTVLTYNSSKYVLETLESIKAQTYQNIELIISDDCSTDNTVEICRNWLDENKERFVATHLIASPVNTGIPANKNRALSKCKGEWTKGIAGDDMLLMNCIENNISIILNNPNINILQTNLNYYENAFSQDKFLRTSNVQDNTFFKDGVTAKQQLIMNLYRNRILAPSIFIKTDVIRKVGGYDEDIPLIEDLPFWVKVAKHGYKIDYSEIITVNYRLHNKSVTKTKNDKEELSSKYAKNLLAYSKKYKQNNVSYIHYFCYNLKLYLIIFLNKFGLSKNIFLRVRFIKNCINQIINI
jgi:alpha-1,3-rhamnosyltransferase